MSVINNELTRLALTVCVPLNARRRSQCVAINGASRGRNIQLFQYYLSTIHHCCCLVHRDVVYVIAGSCATAGEIRL